jgi:predicted DNA-binding mobile mystery protein A
MKNQWLTINQLDRQLKEWQTVKNKYGQPRAGWIKTLRVALSMSAEQLANRLGLTRGRINQLENAEIHDAATLRALKEAANALGCELIYAIVPKGNSTLENIIKNRASEVAQERIAQVAHSMSLEAQSVDTNTLKIQKDELTKSLAEHLNKKLWESPSRFNNLTEAIYIQMQKNKEMEVPTKKNLQNYSIFISKLKEYLIQMQKENHINEPDLPNKLNDPEYINALKNALIRYQISNKKQNKQTDLLQKLIKNLQKKK